MSIKICLLHRNIFHNKLYPKLSRRLSEKYGADIIHVRRHGTIVNEEVFEFEPAIEKIWKKIDVSYDYLTVLVNKYNESDLTKVIFSERGYNFFPRYNSTKRTTYLNQLKYLVGCIEVFERFINKYKPDVIFSDLATGIPDILRIVSKRNGIKYICIRSSKMTPGIVFCDSDYDFPIGLDLKYQKYLSGGLPENIRCITEKHISEIRNEVQLPEYMEVSRRKFKIFSVKRLGSLIFKTFNSRSRITSVSVVKNPVFTSVLWNAHKIFNILHTRLNRKKWFISSLPKCENYFVFTLQYEPENSTSIRAYPYSNQLCVIENIAKALPLGVYLYVKEHNGNQGYRKSCDYKEISYIPNVKLVPKEFSINSLVENSVGVITLTSRMGWEAIVMRKNVITLGTAFYSKIDYIKKPESWDNLKSMILECFNNIERTSYDDLDKDIKCYAGAYISQTFKGVYVYNAKGSLEDKNIRCLTDAMMDVLNV